MTSDQLSDRTTITFHLALLFSVAGLLLRFGGKWFVGNVSPAWAPGDWVQTKAAWLQGACADVGIALLCFGLALFVLCACVWIYPPATTEPEATNTTPDA